jgi:hypothetical protein
MSTVGIVVIVVLVLAVSAGAIYLAHKSGLSIINVALSLVNFIKSTLANSGISIGKLSDVLDLIIQGLVYIQAISDESLTSDEKVSLALNFIKNIAGELDLTLSDEEISIISSVLKIGFIFMNSIGLSSSVVTESNYKLLYKICASKYLDLNTEIKKAGLRYYLK